MIFSKDAPALESALHRALSDKKVNKVNDRKEFFRVDLKEIEELVKRNHNKTVEFTKLAEAEEFRKSVEMTNHSLHSVS
jgi:ribosomal protein L7/L12